MLLSAQHALTAQYTQVEYDIGSADGLLQPAATFKAADEQATEEAAQRGNDNENQKTPIPPAIEYITRHKDEEILPPQPLEYKPVEQKHHWQEYHECERIE